jgi:hypothetical protein
MKVIKDGPLTQDSVRELFIYNEETGEFLNRVNRGHGWRQAKEGQKAGSLSPSDGYLRIRIDGRGYPVHRLAWLYVYGQWPSGEIDHINRIRDDNRLFNLREASISQNRWNRSKNRNNTSGLKGVCFNKKEGKWQASIGVYGKLVHLGLHKTIEAAHAAYCAAAEQFHGEFARTF